MHQRLQLLAAGVERIDELADLVAAARREVRGEIALRQLAHAQS